MMLQPKNLLLFLTLYSSVIHAELIAHWPLDEDANDVLGNHDGSASSVAFGADGATAYSGTAAEFNGSSATITVPYDEALNPESFTLSMWVNADSTSGFASPLTSRDDTPSSVHGYLIYNDNSGNWNFWTGTGGPSGAWNTMSGGAVQTGSWTHLAITYDQTSQTKQLYVNGNLAASNTAANLYSRNGPQTENLHIGSGADSGTSFYFDGLIDDVALWNEPLPASNIQEIMTNGVPGGPPTITSFQADPPLIASGQSVTLSWTTAQANSVSISPEIGEVNPGSGSIMVSPQETTTYTLTATGDSPPAANSQVTIGVDVDALPPVITEFLADNETGLTDPNGEISDWIEIHNPNPFTINIGGYHLTDSQEDLQKFTIPPQQIEAGSYLVLFASNTSGAINFQLARNGEYLALTDPDGNTIQEFSPSYPEQFDDVSFGISNVGSLTYLAPTPGTANGSPQSEIGPAIANATENPPPPEANEDLIIDATITPRIGAVSSANLHYRIGFGNEQMLSMINTEESHFTATIPSSAYQAGEMVRWYITATTATGEASREPPFPDSTQSAQYLGTVVKDPNTNPDQPVINWFVQNPAAADTRAGTQGSLYFEGQFYDNIFCRIRGQSTANWPKHKYKFDFYRGGHFRWKSDAPIVEEFNVNSHYRDSYVRENTIFAFLNEAGALAPETRYLWIKRNGNDMGLFSFVEQVDEEFLNRRGIDADGSMYKAINVPATLSPTVNSGLYRKVLRREESYDDLSALTANIHISNPDRFDYVADAVNLPNYINVMAAMCVPFNHDQLTKNYYMYHDKEREEWFRIAWDGDQGLPTGNKNTQENWTSPLYGDALHTQELVGGNPNPTWQNHLHAAILDNPVTREMYMRRVRTLMDEYLAVPELGDPITILGEGSTARYLVPENPSLESTWFLSEFDDSDWPSGPAGFGYENNPGDYIDLIETRIKPDESTPGATSIYQRYHFEITNPSDFSNLILGMRYDDGFVAYLNGAEIARANISGAIQYNSTASSNPDSDAVNFVYFPLPGTSLVMGDNVLAIQVINQSVGSSDLLCEAILVDQAGANGGYFETLLQSFRDTIQNDVIADQLLWAAEGITNFNNGYNRVLNTSLPNRRTALFETFGPTGSGLIPDPQSPEAVVEFGEIEANPESGNQNEEFIVLRNPDNAAIDLSGWAISGGVELTLPPGTVIPGNGSIHLSPCVHDFRQRTTNPSGGEGLFVIGNFDGHLSNFPEPLILTDQKGAIVRQTMTEDQSSDAQKFLVISEIMYHPASGGEFIELMNISNSVTLDLSGIKFTDGIIYDFPDRTSLAPGSHIVIEEVNFMNGTALSNGGEKLKLEDASNSTIQEFAYDDRSPWPTQPDGEGPSLVLINPFLNPDPSDFSNWRPSLLNGGNPGTSDALSFNGEPDNDADLNGISDLLDYALGDARAITSTPELFRYQRRLGADDISILIEASVDLIDWVDASSFYFENRRFNLGNGIESVEMTARNKSLESKLFLRIRAEKTSP